VGTYSKLKQKTSYQYCQVDCQGGLALLPFRWHWRIVSEMEVEPSPRCGTAFEPSMYFWPEGHGKGMTSLLSELLTA
jgi:hypothetical protein